MQNKVSYFFCFLLLIVFVALHGCKSPVAKKSIDIYDNLVVVRLTVHDNFMVGKVKSLKATTWQAVQGSGGIQKGKAYDPDVIYFNPSGYITGTETFNKSVYTYDNTGKKINTIKSGAEYYELQQYTYDPKGRMAGCNTTMWNGDTYMTEKFDYYDNGALQAITRQNDSGKVWAIHFFYDNDGRLIKRTSTGFKQEDDETDTYSYNPEGTREEKTVIGSKGKIIKTWDYDEHGYQIKYTEVSGSKQIVTVMTYEYDANCNWVKKTSSEDGKPEYITERQIEYYP